uniref:Uncharacterized protein n=1 Tax=Bactrocera dorsalis TaxID=27457 RepID=A0A034VGG5_BACDO
MLNMPRKPVNTNEAKSRLPLRISAFNGGSGYGRGSLLSCSHYTLLLATAILVLISAHAKSALLYDNNDNNSNDNNNNNNTNSNFNNIFSTKDATELPPQKAVQPLSPSPPFSPLSGNVDGIERPLQLRENVIIPVDTVLGVQFMEEHPHNANIQNHKQREEQHKHSIQEERNGAEQLLQIESQSPHHQHHSRTHRQHYREHPHLTFSKNVEGSRHNHRHSYQRIFCTNRKLLTYTIMRTTC